MKYNILIPTEIDNDLLDRMFDVERQKRDMDIEARAKYE